MTTGNETEGTTRTAEARDGTTPDRIVTMTSDGNVVQSPDYRWRVGPFLVDTAMQDEREIDIDDRGAVLVFSLEMTPVGHWQIEARDINVRLEYNFDSVNIALGGMLRGPLTIFKGERLRPGKSIQSRVTVTTGIFCSNEREQYGRPAAPSGAHNVRVVIDYELFQYDEVDNVAQGYVPIIIAQD